MKAVRANTDEQHARGSGVPPEADGAKSVCGMATRVLRSVRGGRFGNPKPQEPVEVESRLSQRVASLLTSAGLPTTAASVEARAGLGESLSRRMLALTLARSQMGRRR